MPIGKCNRRNHWLRSFGQELFLPVEGGGKVTRSCAFLYASTQSSHLLLEFLLHDLLAALEGCCDGLVQFLREAQEGAIYQVLAGKQQFCIRQKLQRPTLAPMLGHELTLGRSVA